MASPGVLLRPVPRGVSLGLDTGPRAAGAGRAELLGQAVPVPWALCPQPSARPHCGARASGRRVAVPGQPPPSACLTGSTQPRSGGLLGEKGRSDLPVSGDLGS